MADATDDRLRLLIERVERLEEEKKGIADDIRDVYAEAKAVGYDVKIMRQIVRLRKMRPDERAEMEAILETYKAALGLDYSDTPLGRATVDRAVGNMNKAVDGYHAARDEERNLRGKIGEKIASAAADGAFENIPGPVTVSVAGGPEIPLNQAARDKVEADV